MNLADTVKHHWQCYMNGTPEITDATFDILVAQLQAQDPAHPMLDYIGPASPGATKHARPMLSLQKVYSLEDLQKWAKNVPTYGLKPSYADPSDVEEFVVMPKYDGMALSLTYENGVLVRALTRGDGHSGEDVTRHAYRIPGLPNVCQTMSFEVRGEVLLQKHRLAEVGGANCRNTVAGIMGSKDPARASFLSFVAYDSDVDTLTVSTLIHRLIELEGLGFEVASVWYGNHSNMAEATQAVQSDMYDLDGIVVVANQNWNRDKLGATSHHPRWAVALKSHGETADSVVCGIEWSVGRTGVVTPVAVIEPVALAGVTISRITVHNVAILRELGCGLGSDVTISRRGGVIPHIESVRDRRGAVVPSGCIHCAGDLIEVGRNLQHVDVTGCPGVDVAKVEYWCKTVGLDGFGAKTLGAHGIYDVLALYSTELPPHLRAQVDAATSLPLAKALEGLGVNSAGKLATTFRSWQNVVKARLDELTGIDGIGQTSAETIQLQLIDAVDILYGLTTVGVTIEPESQPLSSALEGMAFVFTGELATMGRAAAQKLVRDRGGSTPSTVTKKTTHLVAAKETSSSKFQKAKALGVKIIDEEAFKAMIGDLTVNVVGAVDLVAQARGRQP